MKHRSSVRFLSESVEGVAVALVILVTWPFARRWLTNWGSLPSERLRVWPGDRLVRPGHDTSTRAVTVHAQASDVWPWLVQFGLGRAGFYSYELLERLMGIPVKNVERVVPELQELAVGDEILLHPKAPGIPVAAVERERHIVFGELEPAKTSAEASDPARSWSMYIDPRPERETRLLLRSCIEPLRTRKLSRRLAAWFEAPIDFIMEQRMLRTIKRLAESGAAQLGPTPAAS